MSKTTETKGSPSATTEAAMTEAAMTETEEIRCLAILPAGLSEALSCLGALASLAASGRLLAILGTEDQTAVFDPSVLQWRLRRHPDRLSIPLSLLRDGVSAEVVARHDFHEAVLFAPDWRDVSLVRQAGIERAWGYRGGVTGFRLSRGVARPEAERHVDEEARPLVEAMGTRWRPEPLHRPETWGRVGEERLRKARLRPGESPLVGVYVGQDGGDGKAWPVHLFEELLRTLRKQNPNWQFVILSGDGELWQSVLLYERTGKIHPVIGPDLTLDGVASVLSGVDLFVSSDSALLRLAALVDTPTIGLFRRNADRRAPRGRRHRYLERHPLKRLPVEEVAALCEATVARLE